MYLVLFMVVMAALGGSFMTIKIRQRALIAREKLVNAKMLKAQDQIEKFEQLQTKRKTMMKTALTTAELLEPVPRSVLLASLTNNLPSGMSLLQLRLIQKEPKNAPAKSPAISRYQAAQEKNDAATEPKVSPKKMLRTHIDIEGIAPSDLQVADYIERLNNSTLVDNVALVESKEHKIKDSIFRQFKLTAMLKKDAHLTKDDVDSIRTGCKKAAFGYY